MGYTHVTLSMSPLILSQSVNIQRKRSFDAGAAHTDKSVYIINEIGKHGKLVQPNNTLSIIYELSSHETVIALRISALLQPIKVSVHT